MKNVNKSNNKTEYILLTVLVSVIICGITGAYFYLKNIMAKMGLFLTVIALAVVLLLILLKWHKMSRKLFTILDNSARDEKAKYGDFEKRLTTLVTDRDELVCDIKRKENYIRARAISELMEGKSIDNEIRNLLPAFDGKLSVLFVAYGKDALSDRINKGVRETAKGIFSELANISFVENRSGGILWMIANFTEPTETLKENIERTSRKFINTLKSEFQIGADVIYGRITKSEEDIPAIYREVKDAAFLCQRDGCIIDAEKIAQRDYDVYNYSVDTEISIIIYIKKGDFSRAYGLIRNALDEIISEKLPDIHNQVLYV